MAGMIGWVVENTVPFFLNVVWPPIYWFGQMIIMFFLVLPLSIADMLLQAVDVFSGVSYVSYQGQEMNILNFFFNQNIVSRAFWGVTLIALALCLGFSIFSVIRSMGDSTLRRPIGKVMGDTIKAMLIFMMVPFMCITVINLSTVVLRQVQVAISGAGTGEAASITGSLFVTATTVDCVRRPWQDWEPQGTWRARGTHVYFHRWPDRPFSEQQIIDHHRAVTHAYAFGHRRITWGNMDHMVNNFNAYSMVTNGSYFVIVFTSFFLIVMVAMIMMIFLQRIFEVMILYIVSPLFVAPMPLDEGAKFRGWRDAFIGKVLSGFGSVITLQVFVLMLPLIMNPNFVLHPNSATNGILKALLLLGGIFSTYKSHTVISSLVSSGQGGSDGAAAAFMKGAVIGKIMHPRQTARKLLHKSPHGSSGGHKHSEHPEDKKDKKSNANPNLGATTPENKKPIKEKEKKLSKADKQAIKDIADKSPYSRQNLPDNFKDPYLEAFGPSSDEELFKSGPYAPQSLPNDNPYAPGAGSEVQNPYATQYTPQYTAQHTPAPQPYVRRTGTVSSYTVQRNMAARTMRRRSGGGRRGGYRRR